MKMATGGKCKTCHEFFTEMKHNDPRPRAVNDEDEGELNT